MPEIQPEQEPAETLILDAYREGRLFSSQKDANDQESLNRSIHRQGDCIDIMISPDNQIIILDGHHRTGNAILEGTAPRYRIQKYDPSVRYWPFETFLRKIKEQYPPEYWLYR